MVVRRIPSAWLARLALATLLAGAAAGGLGCEDAAPTGPADASVVSYHRGPRFAAGGHERFSNYALAW